MTNYEKFIDGLKKGVEGNANEKAMLKHLANLEKELDRLTEESKIKPPLPEPIVDKTVLKQVEEKIEKALEELKAEEKEFREEAKKHSLRFAAYFDGRADGIRIATNKWTEQVLSFVTKELK